jgi:DNA repair protein RadC
MVYYVRELEIKYKGRSKKIKATLSTPQAVYELMRKYMKDSPKEMLWALYLDTKNKLIGYNNISVGTVSESIGHPREIFQGAFLTNASGIILCHNHPSNDLSISADDRHITKRIIECGKILGIKLIDHVIVSSNNYISIRETTNMFNIMDEDI